MIAFSTGISGGTRHLLVPMALVLASMASCTAVRAGEAAMVDERIVQEWHDYYSQAKESKHFVISGAAEWQRIWQHTYAKRQPLPEVPNVDFSKHIVLAAFLGQQRTGGYDIRITRVTRTVGGATVHVWETRPEPGGMVTQALTAPVHFVVVPKVDGKVDFMVEER